MVNIDADRSRVLHLVWVIAIVLGLVCLLGVLVGGCVLPPSSADLAEANRLEQIVDSQQSRIIDQQRQIEALLAKLEAPDTTPEEFTESQTKLAKLIAEKEALEAEITAQGEQIADLRDGREVEPGEVIMDTAGSVAPFLPPPFGQITAGVLSLVTLIFAGKQIKDRNTP
ncbi:MAG TPA: hypothetical protein VFG22_02025 [Polyangiales bacterium]|nr:hypothetical protein [Polyangiales bacterium]